MQIGCDFVRSSVSMLESSAERNRSLAKDREPYEELGNCWKYTLPVVELASGMQGLLPGLKKPTLWRLMLRICWHLLHFTIIIAQYPAHWFRLLHYYFISSGILKKYRDLPLHKLQHLAIVVDSEEAADTSRVRNLLQFLLSMGIRNIILYDMDGVLKRSESSLCGNGVYEDKMSIEIISYSDGKEAIARASNFICSKYKGDDHLIGGCGELELSESDLSDALKALGYNEAEPELLLVFASVRCHLGFPAWRMRYTEIVHLGELKSMNRGAIIRAIYDLSRKQQNYGS